MSYARDDRALVERLAETLEADGLTVWWDRHIEAGHEFARDIEAELEAAKAVIVCWSKSGSASRWVKDEAGIAAESDKLVAVSLDGSPPPIGFKQYHALPLEDWSGKPGDDEMAALLSAVRHRIDPEDKSPAAPAARDRASSISRGAIAAGALFFALVAAVVFIWQPWDSSVPFPAPPTTATMAEEQTSIAVLPFEDLSQAGDQQFFADGISEEILNVLARVDGLRVASRTSAFQYRGNDKPVRTIANELGVRHILEGSVRTSGNRIRITAQLIDANTDEHRWSQTYDRDLTTSDLFEIQDEIAKGIVAELGKQLDLGSAEAIRFAAAADTDNLAAYQAFLRGQALFNDRSAIGDYHDVLVELRRAVDLDPNFARAWIGLASAYSVSESYLSGDDYDAGDYPRLAREAVDRAISLEPDMAAAYTAKSNVGLMGRYDAAKIAQAYEDLNHALALDPRDSLALNWRGQLLYALGDLEGAYRDGRAALALDPSDTVAWQMIVMLDVVHGRLDEAVKATEEAGRPLGITPSLLAMALIQAKREKDALKVISLNPNVPSKKTFAFVKAAATRQLTPAEALKEIAKLRGQPRVDPRNIDPFTLYMIRDFDSLYEVQHGVFPIYWMRNWKEWLQHPARYAEIMDMGIDDYWRERGYPPQCRPIAPRPDGRDFVCD
ncbi:TIR domain-containing protein [Sphingomicrobium nitratireducens]|uniref:TIR domain-containing protein n=1 Tax=Sphingomicrobium nitratireducens TaxID=2964666 RepID=UPI00223EA884